MRIKGKVVARRNKREEEIHLSICRYIRYQYPNIIFNSDMSGVRLSRAQAGISKAQRSNHKFPDLVIYEAYGCDSSENKSCTREINFHALFLELKAEKVEIYQRTNPEKYANKHIETQASTLEALRKKGYAAEFAIGFDRAKELIDNYVQGRWNVDFN